MKSIFLFAIMTVIMVTACVSQDATGIRKKHFNISDGVAVKGYDAAAYFTKNKAVKGSKDKVVAYEGVLYYFSSVETKELFNANPAKYEPQYGGWCAYAMGNRGEKVNIDPETFKIVNGKLYLFYNKFFNNTLTDWNKDESNLKRKADANWIKLLN